MDLVVFITQTLPYITVSVFFLGWAYRLISWAEKKPSRTLVLFPVKKPGFPTSLNILKRVFIFAPLYSADKLLWFTSTLFLIGMFLSISLHAFINYPFTTLLPKAFGLPDIWTVLGVSAATRVSLSYLLGSLSAILVLTAVFVFLVRRVAIPEVRYLSTFQEYSSLIYLLVIISLGTYMRLFNVVDHAHLKAYLTGLAHLRPISPPESTIFLIHLTLAQFYLMTLPFSKAAHSIGTIMVQKIEQWR